MLTDQEAIEFFDRLAGPEGCDFKEKTPDSGDWTWRCAGGQDKTYAWKILRLMEIPEERAQAFLEECEQHGGHCDCEIIFNAKDRFVPPGAFDEGEDT